MRALSIRQPWAWAILYAGKDVENRNWCDRYPPLTEAKHMGLVGGLDILIHAGMAMTRADYEDCLDDLHDISERHPFPTGLALPAFDDLPRGGIVGKAQLYDVVTESASPWFFGPVGLLLRNAKPLPFVPLKGVLGFFDAPNPAA